MEPEAAVDRAASVAAAALAVDVLGATVAVVPPEQLLLAILLLIQMLHLQLAHQVTQTMVPQKLMCGAAQVPSHGKVIQ